VLPTLWLGRCKNFATISEEGRERTYRLPSAKSAFWGVTDARNCDHPTLFPRESGLFSVDLVEGLAVFLCI
jgi:hypothetical protein